MAEMKEEMRNIRSLVNKLDPIDCFRLLHPATQQSTCGLKRAQRIFAMQNKGWKERF